MAKQTLNTIKNWFKTGLKPTQQQFWDTWDSFWHKDDAIAAQNIQGLDNLLNGKADKQAFDNHLNDANAHGIGTLKALIERPAPKEVSGQLVYRLEWSPELLAKYGKYARPLALVNVPDSDIWKPVTEFRTEYNPDGSTAYVEWDLDGLDAKIFEN